MNLSRLRTHLRRGVRGALVSSLLLVPALAHAADIHVPSSLYPTIQDGINAAVNGDTVLIASGTYTGDGNRDMNFGGKNLTVTSESGNPFDVTIDCQGSPQAPHRAFSIISGEQNVTVNGLTITNAESAADAGAFYISTNGVTVTISNCLINHCIADSGVGGGLFVF